jgi:hypothetical protein
MHRLGLAALAIVGACLPAAAAPLDVTFTGLVVDTCTIAIATPGIMMLSGDGTILGSDQGLGVPATVTVLSIGTNNIALSAPVLETHPVGYTPGGETIAMNTSGLASNPVFTSLGIDFDIGLLSLTSLFVNMKVTDPAGFTQGTYTAKTVLTCS